MRVCVCVSVSECAHTVSLGVCVCAGLVAVVVCQVPPGEQSGKLSWEIGQEEMEDQGCSGLTEA